MLRFATGPEPAARRRTAGAEMVRASKLLASRRPTAGQGLLPGGSPQSSEVVRASELLASRRPGAGRNRLSDGGPQSADGRKLLLDTPSRPPPLPGFPLRY